jgi:hypothetical protein
VSGKAARNERRKALAGTFSAIGLGMLAAAFFQPLATGRWPGPAIALLALASFFASQAAVHYILSRLKD